jgi:hypothetical protein
MLKLLNYHRVKRLTNLDAEEDATNGRAEAAGNSYCTGC